MAIAKKPKRNHLISRKNQKPEQKARIDNSSKPIPALDTTEMRAKVPVLLRIDRDLLERIDRAARELGLKRAAFIVSSAAERLKRLES